MNRTALDQYEGLVTDALNSCSAKLRKSFKTAFIQLMILYMVLPRKNNASGSCSNVSLTGYSSISSLCGSGLEKALEKP